MAMLIVVAVAASACTFTENTHYRVDNDGYSGVNATIYERPTNQLAVIYDGICHRQIMCTADLLRQNVKIDGWGYVAWTGGTYQYPSLEYEINNVINQGALNNWNLGGPCLVMNYWVTLSGTDLINHWAWRTHGVGGSCKEGVGIAQ